MHELPLQGPRRGGDDDAAPADGRGAEIREALADAGRRLGDEEPTVVERPPDLLGQPQLTRPDSEPLQVAGQRRARAEFRVVPQSRHAGSIVTRPGVLTDADG